MAKQKFVSVKPLKPYTSKWQYAILLGERSNGKSYSVKEFVLKNYRDKGGKFIYLRRYQIETKPSYVDGYFRDAPVSQIFDDYESITAYRGGIYLSKLDEESGKIVRGDCIGYSAHLSSESHFKSQNYNDVTDIIFEEFVTSEGYLYREVEKLMSFISTVARRRRVRVWLIGNTISRLCPYFSEWGLSNIPKQEQGTIETYEHTTDQTDENGDPISVKIAVYFCENSGNNSKMFFGTAAKMTTTGTWQTREYPHLPYRYRECQNVYSMLYSYKEFMFKFEVLRHKNNGELSLFVHPFNIETARDGMRIISDIPDTSPFSSTSFVILTKGDKLIDYLWKTGKVFYCDNLTGSDIDSILADKGEL